jgi:hypothetical protein
MALFSLYGPLWTYDTTLQPHTKERASGCRRVHKLCAMRWTLYNTFFAEYILRIGLTNGPSWQKTGQSAVLRQCGLIGALFPKGLPRQI